MKNALGNLFLTSSFGIFSLVRVETKKKSMSEHHKPKLILPVCTQTIEIFFELVREKKSYFNL
jgi:hypothetical protein